MKIKKIFISGLTLLLLLSGIQINSASADHNYISYIHPSNALRNYFPLGSFRNSNNANYSVSGHYRQHYNHFTDPNRSLQTSSGNYKYTFNPYGILPRDHGLHNNPQAIAINKHGEAFVTYDFNNMHAGDKTSICKYNIHDKHFGCMQKQKYGKVFHGGHGQALAYNPKTNQLWLEYNIGGQGSRNNVKLFLINQKTLQPEHEVKFNFFPYTFGAVLAFDKKGNAYTATDTFQSQPGGSPQGSLKIFKGKITTHGANFHMIQGLQHTPGAIMQNLSYNPANNRLYFISDGNITSAPVNELGHLNPKHVRATRLTDHYELEGLGFYKKRSYLLVHYPSQLLIGSHKNLSPHRYYGILSTIIDWIRLI